MKIGELVAMLRVDRTQFDRDVDGAEGKFRSVGSRLGAVGKAVGMAAGAGAGVALAAGIANNLEMGAARAKLSAQLGSTGPESQRYGQIAGQLYSQAYGSSLDEVNQAVRAVVQNIGGMANASSTDIQSVTANVMSLATAFDQDLGATTRAVDQMISTGLAPNAQAALDIIAAGFQAGADEGGDLLDTVTEYGTQFRKVGVDGQTAMGLISQGLKAGARDADVVADSIKEFSIRAVDGSKTTAQGFQALGLDAQDMAAKIGQGGPVAAGALDMTLDRLRAMPDPVARSQAAVALFGTQAEDLGDALYSLDPSSAVNALGQVAGAAGRTDQALSDTAQNKIEMVRRKFQMLAVDAVNLPGPFGVAAAAIAAAGPAALTALGPIASMVAAQRAAAAASVAAGATQKASWISTAVTAVGSAIKTGAAWVISTGAGAAAAVARTVATVAVIVAQWLLMAAQSTLAAGRAALAWLLVNGAGAAMAIARMAVTVGLMLAQWLIMAAGSMASAIVMAAAWFVALGPIGWVIAIIVGLVVLIIANWDTVKSWTLAAWSAITSFISNAWSTIVSTVAGWIAACVAFVVNGWNSAKAMTSAAWSALVATIATWIGNAITWVAGIPGKVMSALSGLGSLLVGSGRALVDGFLNGIKSAWNAVVGWVKDGIAAVRALFPFSPAKTGPFSGSGYVTHSGKAIATDFAKSLRGGESGIISSARRIVEAANTELAPKRLGVPSIGSNLPGDAWLSRAGDAATRRPSAQAPSYSGPDAGAIADAVHAGVHAALDKAEMRVDGRGVAKLTNRQNARDKRLGGTRIPTMTGQGR